MAIYTWEKLLVYIVDGRSTKLDGAEQIRELEITIRLLDFTALETTRRLLNTRIVVGGWFITGEWKIRILL